jgi:homoserine O-succinyltransferase
MRSTNAGALVRIGLVNNMPDAAFEVTERQFRRLVEAALHPRQCSFDYFALPGIERSEIIRADIARRYRPAELLPDCHLDVLIVSGASPLQADLRSEAYWPALALLIDRVLKCELPTIFSCLAAHAAVLHLDGIWRQRLTAKRSGVFVQTAVQSAAGSDPILAGLSAPFVMPHSRWNGLDADALLARGYRILSRQGGEVDCFVRHGTTPMLFLQGHPEYDPRSLLLEYQRDMRRFLDGTAPNRPAIPANYFDPATELQLAETQQRAAPGGRATTRAALAGILANFQPSHSWRADAELLFRNWLDLALGCRAAEPAAQRIFA